MDLDQFKQFVGSHDAAFNGVRPQTLAELNEFERLLKHKLPETLKWLLSTKGYSTPCGITSLAAAIRDTLRCRDSIGLPEKYLVLNDWNDAGVVVLDLTNGNLCWCGTHNIRRLAAGTPVDDDSDWFEDYPAWVAARLIASEDEE